MLNAELMNLVRGAMKTHSGSRVILFRVGNAERNLKAFSASASKHGLDGQVWKHTLDSSIEISSRVNSLVSYPRHGCGQLLKDL